VLSVFTEYISHQKVPVVAVVGGVVDADSVVNDVGEVVVSETYTV